MRKKNDLTPDDWRTIKFVILIVAIILAWIVWASAASSIAKWAVYDTDTTKSGTWGDSFGGFNALFGALGFAAVFATLIVQQRSLRDQQIDQHVQRFEATFFELLRLMRELRGQLSYTTSPDLVSELSNRAGSKTKSPVRLKRSGVDAITSAHTETKYWIRKLIIQNKTITKEEIAHIYMKFVHSRYESRFSAYFRIVYTILNNIKRDKFLSEEQKAYYGNILRSQLTSHEISLLAINSTAKVAKDLGDLISYFRMLKYLPDGTTRKALQKIFSDEAFQARD